MLSDPYPISTTRLSNGLQVLVNPDPNSPGVALNLWYRVGSANETTGNRGFAHLFEHLMFAGSAQVANGEHLAAIQAIGGTVNATTSFDRTNYFETVPRGGLELALWLEADRMHTLAVNQSNLEVQREVVKEEKRQRYDNVPYGDHLELLLSLNFPPTHPYAVPTIGFMADLDAAHLEQVQDFYQLHYRPSQASLVIAGATTADEAFTLAEHYFGGIDDPGPATTPIPVPALEPHLGTPRVSAVRAVPAPLLELCWRLPGAGDDDELAIGAALAVLASGQASRLERALVRETGLADLVEPMAMTLVQGTSLATLVARPRQNQPPELIEELICAELETLANEGPTQPELDRVQANWEREWFTELSMIDSRADQLNEFACSYGRPELLNEWEARAQAVRPADVARVCATWLAPEHRAVLEYVREDAE